MLVVESDPQFGKTLGAWLDRAGYEVLTCPGPTAPDYVCIAGRGEVCPLHAAADLVVLNLRLSSDEAMEGMPAWQLLLHYTAAGSPVVVLASPEDAVRPFPEENGAVLRRPPSRGELLDAVDRLLRGRAAASLTSRP